VRITKR